METLLYLLYQAAGSGTDDSARRCPMRPTWLFGKTVHDGCDRAGYYEQGIFATEYGQARNASSSSVVGGPW